MGRSACGGRLWDAVSKIGPANSKNGNSELTSQDELANGGDEAREEGIVRLLEIILKSALVLPPGEFLDSNRNVLQ